MKTVWVTSSTANDKPWGNETCWGTGAGRIAGKVLEMNEGQRTSLKYNTIKNETLFVLKGEIIATFSDEKFEKHMEFQSRVLKPGDCMNIQSGCPYRLKAIKKSTVVEIGDSRGSSTVRFHDDYGRTLSHDVQAIVSSSTASEKALTKSDI